MDCDKDESYVDPASKAVSTNNRESNKINAYPIVDMTSQK